MRKFHRARAPGARKSRKMAVPRHGNNRTCRRHRHIRVFDWPSVVGRRRPAGRAALHARFCRGTFGAVPALGKIGESPGAGHFQWQDFRLAAAGKSFSHDALDCRAQIGGASGFAASRASALEISPGHGAFGRSGAEVLNPTLLGWHREDDISSNSYRNFISIICAAARRNH